MSDFEIINGVLIKYTGQDNIVNIPNSVTTIEVGAFYRCHTLTSIEIPNSVTSIRHYAFYGCEALTSIKIPNSVTWIGCDAFEGCKALTSIEIPNSVISIGTYAFSGCKALTSIEIPNSVTHIKSRAFKGCTNLTNIIIGNNIKYIESRAFDACKIKHNSNGNIAYKGFRANMTCRGFQYEEGKTYVCNEAKLCHYGFHACLNPLDCFNYYYGEDSVYHEVILEDRTNKVDDDSKVCGKKITIGRRLTIQEMFSIFNELNKE